MLSFASAKEAYVDVNNVRFYFVDSSGYFTGPQYPPKAGGLLNNSFPTPGGRTYAHGPMFMWGNSINAPGAVPDGVTTFDVSEETVWGGSQYESGAFVTGTKSNGMVASTYTINSLGGENYKAANVTTSADEEWYNPTLGTGTPDNKWPYSNLEFAYNPASVEPWINVNTGDYHSSDAFLNPLPGYEMAPLGERAYALYVSDVSQITDLKDYVMIFDGTNFNVYEVTGYDVDYTPLYGGTAVATFAPDTDATFNGITINMNVGTATTLTNGDAYIIRARGIVGDMDMVLPMTDSKLLADGPFMTGDPSAAAYGRMDVVILIRAYAWTASYIDTTVVFDVTFDNQSSRTYENFAAGFQEYMLFAYEFDDSVQYISDENLILMYDHDGDIDTVQVGAGSADDVQWHTGDFGSSPYAMVGLKILRPLTKEGSAPASRMTVKTGYGAEFFPYQNGASTPGDITGNVLDFVPVVETLDTSGGAAEAFASCDPSSPTWGGVEVRPDGSWNTWLWNDDIWDLLVSGRVNYCYDPTVLNDTTRFYYAFRGSDRKGSASTVVGWYLGSLAPGEKASMIFAVFAVGKEEWAWSMDYPQVGDPTFDAAMDLSANLDLLYENHFAPKFTPLRPMMVAAKGYSTYFGEENETMELEWLTNSETSFITQLSDEFTVERYVVKRYDGSSYKNILELRALMDDLYWQWSWGVDNIYQVYEVVRDYYPSYLPYYFSLDADYADNHIIWFESSQIPEMVISSDADLQYQIGFRVNDAETAPESYVVVIADNVFGYAYKYIIQAQDYAGSLSAAAGENKFDIVTASLPATGMDAIRVVPNPLFVGTRWDKYADVSEVKFNHIPGECTIRIYNINGDLLREIKHDNGLSWESWDLLTKYNQEIAPGMYIYVIESELGKAKGTFAVVR